MPAYLTTHLLVHRPTQNLIYISILMVQWQVITKTYVSNQLVVYVSMDAPFPKNYLFIFILSSRLTTKTYFSIQLFLNIS